MVIPCHRGCTQKALQKTQIGESTQVTKKLEGKSRCHCGAAVLFDDTTCETWKSYSFMEYLWKIRNITGAFNFQRCSIWRRTTWRSWTPTPSEGWGSCEGSTSTTTRSDRWDDDDDLYDDDHDDGGDDDDDHDDDDGSCSTSPTTDQVGEKMEFNECKMERLCTIRWMNIQTNLIEGGAVDIPTFVLLLY